MEVVLWIIAIWFIWSGLMIGIRKDCEVVLTSGDRIINSWQNKYNNLSIFLKYPTEIQKIIYTTNIIESIHRQFRKLTKTKGAFPNENSLLKLLYLGIKNASKKWTMPIRNWSLTLSQLAIFFEGRLNKYLDV